MAKEEKPLNFGEIVEEINQLLLPQKCYLKKLVILNDFDYFTFETCNEHYIINV